MTRVLAAALVFAAGCSKKSGDRDKPEAPPPRATPDAGAKKVELVIRAGAVGPLTRANNKDAAEIARALAGYQVAEETYSAEGDEYTTLFVKDGDKKLLNIEEHYNGSGLSITVLDEAVRDEAGVGLGSTHAQLAATYADLSCTRDKLDEAETEGMGSIDSVVCTSASMANVEWSFDIRSLELPGEGLPPPDKLAPLRVSGLSVALI